MLEDMYNYYNYIYNYNFNNLTIDKKNDEFYINGLVIQEPIFEMKFDPLGKEIILACLNKIYFISSDSTKGIIIKPGIWS